MTKTHRILLNTAATYGRSIVGVICGIFSMRWVLMSLGDESFGLYGVVGSLVLFVIFLNIQFASALSRFYAFSIGKAQSANKTGQEIEEIREWFSSGVLIHLVVPTLLVVIGYPIGKYAICNNWLTIPANRVDVCVWLWRFAMISAFVSMANAPFQAMYTAKQYIVELTVYNIGQVIAKTMFIYYMTTVHRDWLFGYGLMMCILAITPQLIVCIRAMFVFEECRFRFKAIRDATKIWEIAKYSWWQTFNGLGYLARHQWLEVVVNKFFGPKVNAAYTVGLTLGAESAALTGALNAAFTPAITTECGEGNVAQMKRMAFQSCKFGTLLTLMFALPLALEIQEVLRLWLKTPPRHSATLCLFWIVAIIIEKLTLGHGQAVQAVGKIARFQFWRGLVSFVCLPLSILAILINRHIYSVGMALIITTLMIMVCDVVVAQKDAGMNVKHWVHKIVLPIAVGALISVFCGLLPRLYLDASIWRVCVTTFVTVSSLGTIAWFAVFDGMEQRYVVKGIARVLPGVLSTH